MADKKLQNTEQFSNENLKSVFHELHSSLVETINISTVIDKLFGAKVISIDDIHGLDSFGNGHEKCRRLLLILHKTKHPRAFVELRRAINDESSNEWLIKDIDEKYKRVSAPAAQPPVAAAAEPPVAQDNSNPILRPVDNETIGGLTRVIEDLSRENTMLKGENKKLKDDMEQMSLERISMVNIVDELKRKLQQIEKERDDIHCNKVELLLIGQRGLPVYSDVMNDSSHSPVGGKKTNEYEPVIMEYNGNDDATPGAGNGYTVMSAFDEQRRDACRHGSFTPPVLKSPKADQKESTLVGEQATKIDQTIEKTTLLKTPGKIENVRDDIERNKVELLTLQCGPDIFSDVNNDITQSPVHGEKTNEYAPVYNGKYDATPTGTGNGAPIMPDTIMSAFDEQRRDALQLHVDESFTPPVLKSPKADQKESVLVGEQTTKIDQIIQETTLLKTPDQQPAVSDDFQPRPSESPRKFRDEVQDWHSGSELNERVKTFHDKYARQPQGIQKAKGIHTKYLGEIAGSLRSKGCCSRIEYTGSTYEGVKVAKSSVDEDLEFDVMIIMDGGSLLKSKDAGLPGFVRLTPRNKDELTRLPGLLSDRAIYDDQEDIDAQKLYSKFFGLIQHCIKESQEMRGKVKLVKHGPATQIDVYHQSDDSGMPSGAKFYSVDIVPAFDIGNGRIFVAKQRVKDQESRALTSSWWRQSFSVDEKKKLDAADRNNGCRKQVFRILKVIRNRETTLSKLTSYHLKTALFREMDKPGLSWTIMDVGKRLMGVLEELDRELSYGRMPHYFVPGIDLLDGLLPITIYNIGSRISRLRMSVSEMTNVLTQTG